MTPETQGLIDKLLRSARNAKNAVNPAQRDAAQAFLVKRADELRGVRDGIEAKLTRQITWLEAAAPGLGDADEAEREWFARREAQYLALLEEYEAICRALDEALVTWLHKEGVAA